MILRKVIKYIIYSDEISFSGTKHKRRYLVCQENIDRCPAKIEMSYFYQNRNVLLEEKI